MESRESLNDSYREHSLSSQEDALDAEASAYEETMNKMVEGMRASLEEATADMDTFLNNVTIAVSMNADTVLEKYRETNVYLDPALTNPWENAKTKVGEYGDKATNLMDVWKKDGYFAEFKSTASTNLSSPWSAGTTAANTFKSSVYTVMSNVVSNIATNVKTASGELSKLYQQIIDTEARAASVDLNDGGDGNSWDSVGVGAAVAGAAKQIVQKSVDSRILSKYKLTSDQVLALGYGPISLEKFEDLLRTYQIKYSAAYATKQVANMGALERSLKKVINGNYVSGPMAIGQYAKGTMGTTSDQWMLTDELGDELVMYATPEGTLSYARVGTTVVPADITQNLVEWGKLNPNMMNMPSATPNINMINNAVNKPEFNFNVDKFLHCDNVTQDSLPELKQFVKTEMNNLVKNMNYAIKGKGGR